MAKQEERESTRQSQKLQDIGNDQAVHLEGGELPRITPGVMICSTGCKIIRDNLSRKDIIHIMYYYLLSSGQQWLTQGHRKNIWLRTMKKKFKIKLAQKS